MFHLPVVHLVDIPGFLIGQEAEKAGHHARLEAVTAESFALLASLPRWLAAEGIGRQADWLLKAGDTIALFGSQWKVSTLTLITLLFLCGAFAKSAQLPFHVWLPDAMEAPTPVSALIHAATMVTAGVFLIARFAPLYDLAPATLSVLAFVGAASAFFAAAVSMVQTDIKRILAYSTMCQQGYMMLACGLGAYGLAIFHLVAHAAFKSLLFLTAGTAIEEVAARQDSPGSLRSAGWFPARFWLLWASAVALASMPPLVLIAGGKGLFRLASLSEHGHPVFWALTWAAALMTVVYLLRLVRDAERRSGPDATPLRLLSPRALAFVAGWSLTGQPSEGQAPPRCGGFPGSSCRVR